MQLLVIPVCSVVMFVVSPATEKSPATTWQVVQVDSVVGMWPAGLAWPVNALKPV